MNKRIRPRHSLTRQWRHETRKQRVEKQLAHDKAVQEHFDKIPHKDYIAALRAMTVRPIDADGLVEYRKMKNREKRERRARR